MAKPYALFADSSRSEPAGAQFDRNGVPVRAFVKDIARVGHYRHPRDNWELDITPEKLQRWCNTFEAMRSNGVDVEVVEDHSHDAEAVRGYVTEMWVEDGVLYGKHEMAGSKGIELAETVRNTSPWIERDFRDGKNNHYGEAIIHSAIVQGPVIPSQEGFQAIAASLRQAGANPLILQMEHDTMIDLEALKAALGIEAEVTEENAVQLIADRLKEAESEKAKAEGKATEAQSKIEQLQAKLTEAEAERKPRPDADALDIMAETTEAAIEALAESGKIVPALAASLKTILVGPEDNRNAYAMSRTYSGREKALAREIIEALKENPPAPETGEQTGPQSMSLGGRPGDDPEAAAAEEQRKKTVEGIVAKRKQQHAA